MKQTPPKGTKRGRFIAFEGIDGTGKSTLIKNLVKEYLVPQKIPFVLTREPGGSDVSESIRKMLLNKHGALDAVTELLLLFAARNEHVKDLIGPALEAGEWVICDRFSGSTHAYQGLYNGIDVKMIRTLEKMTHPHLQPDMTLLLDMPAEAALSRIKGDRDRYESNSEYFFDQVRRVYLSDARKSDSIQVIDASADVKTVTQCAGEAIQPLVEDWLQAGRPGYKDLMPAP